MSLILLLTSIHTLMIQRLVQLSLYFKVCTCVFLFPFKLRIILAKNPKENVSAVFFFSHKDDDVLISISFSPEHTLLLTDSCGGTVIPLGQREPGDIPALPGLLCPGLCLGNAGPGASALLGVINEIVEFCSCCLGSGTALGMCSKSSCAQSGLVKVGNAQRMS